MPRTDRPVPVRSAAARAAWSAGAVFLGAFAAFEMIKHMGWTLPLGLLGAVLPLLAGRHRLLAVLDHPLPPLIVLTGAALLTESQQQAAPPFTLGLTWLGCVAVRRALPRDGRRSRPSRA